MRQKRSGNLNTENLITELNELSTKNQVQYRTALVRLVINKLAKERNLMFGRIDYLFKDDKVPKDDLQEYYDMVFTQFSIPTNDVPNLIRDLSSGKQISNQHFKDLHNEFNGEWNMYEATSNRIYGYVKCEYPLTHFMARLWNTSYRDPSSPVAGKDLGPYPNTSIAIIDLLDLDQVREGGWLGEQAVVIIIPDYRARIKKLKIKKDKVQLEIESKFLTDDDLQTQFYIDGQSFPNVNISKGIAQVPSSDNPKEIFALVKEKRGTEHLDYIHHNITWTGFEESVEKEIPEDIVREWINRGESDNVEFKEVLTHADDVMKSVVAFANTRGGVILLGVRDDCSISGYDEPIEETKNRLERMIAEKCDPPVDFKIEQVDLAQKITVIKIPKGKNKIYAVTNGGIYVRRGSSDRFIKPSELIEMFENKNRDNERTVF